VAFSGYYYDFVKKEIANFGFKFTISERITIIWNPLHSTDYTDYTDFYLEFAFHSLKSPFFR